MRNKQRVVLNALIDGNVIDLPEVGRVALSEDNTLCVPMQTPTGTQWYVADLNIKNLLDLIDKMTDEEVALITAKNVLQGASELRN